MDSDFWNRVVKRLYESGMTRKVFLAKTGLNSASIPIGQKRRNEPVAGVAYLCAKALGTTVEALVDGEEGEAYVREIVIKEGKAFTPPPRIADIVEGVGALSDTELIPIRAAVEATVKAKKSVSKSA
jgi:hypothetical protein